MLNVCIIVILRPPLLKKYKQKFRNKCGSCDTGKRLLKISTSFEMKKKIFALSVIGITQGFCMECIKNLPGKSFSRRYNR